MKRLHLSNIFLTGICFTSIYHSPLFARSSSVQTDECYDGNDSNGGAGSSGNESMH